MFDSNLLELSVVFVGTAQMSQLHQQFMGMAGATDVLTFDLDDGREGEIVICLPVAKKQAESRGIPLRDELLLYAIHGMLHLSGWDDKSSAGFDAMHRKEDQILRQLGVGTVFARPEREATSRDRERAVSFNRAKTVPLRSRLVKGARARITAARRGIQS